MTITVASFIMFLGIFQLLLAALNVPGLSRWNWLAGGMLFWGISLFVSFNFH